MDFQKIRAGISGSQFIDIFNENIDLNKSQLETLAASVLLRVIANNIQEIKAIDGTLYFTLDGEEWISTNTNVWGDITGDISHQPDLMELFNSKANSSDLTNTSNLLNTTRESLSNLKQTVETNTSNITRNSQYIGTLQQLLGNAISSQDIKGFRLSLSNGVLQYTTDGVTWVNVISTEEIDWTDIGAHGGTSNPRDNVDLNAIFTGIETAISNHLNDKENPHEVTLEQLGIDGLVSLIDIEVPITEYITNIVTLLTETVEVAIANKLNKHEGSLEDIVYLTSDEYYERRNNDELDENTIYIVN